MEFSLEESFFGDAADTAARGKARRGPSSSSHPAKVKSPSLLCHLSGEGALFAGRSDGPIVLWHPQQKQSRKKEVKVTTLVGHHGSVQCLDLMNVSSSGKASSSNPLLLSGSADRTIKVWDYNVKDTDSACIQTLSGHGATITDVKYGDSRVISCSNDKTIRVWQAEKGREYLLHPWLMCVQVIENSGSAWATAAALRTGEVAALYVGDSQGTLSVYVPTARLSGGTMLQGGGFVLQRRQERVHRLGITHCKLVPEQNFVITTAFDGALRVFDAMTGVPFLTITNQHRCRFTGLAWNPREQELFCGDSMGHLYVWNIYMERCLKTERLHTGAITSVSVQPKEDLLVITTEVAGSPSGGNSGASSGSSSARYSGDADEDEDDGYGDSLDDAMGGISRMKLAGRKERSARGGCLQQWKIERDLKFVEFAGHTEPVLSVLALNGGSASATQARGQEEQRFFSASLDNTIRCWDPYDMGCLFTLTESVSEISCMTHLPHCGLLATGHDNGSVRWWNPDSGSTVTLSHHSNTVSCLTLARLNRHDYLLTAGFDGAVGVWDVTKRRSVKPQLEYMFQAHTGDDREILCICYDGNSDMGGMGMDDGRGARGGGGKGGDKQCFVTAGNDCVLRCWNMGSYTLQAELSGHEDAVTSLALDAHFLFSGGEDKTIRIWNIASLADAYQLCVLRSAHTRCIRDMLLLPDLGYLASCSFDGHIKLWDYSLATSLDENGDGKFDSHKAVVHEYRHHDQLRCLAYSAPEKQLLAGTEQHRILLFQLPKHLTDPDVRAAAAMEAMDMEMGMEFGGPETDAEAGEHGEGAGEGKDAD